MRFYSALKEVSVSNSRIYIQGLSAKDCNDKSNQIDLSLVFTNFELGDAESHKNSEVKLALGGTLQVWQMQKMKCCSPTVVLKQ